MVSVAERAKRALVIMIKRLATLYSVTMTLTRDSADSAVRAAYRKISRKTHPDRGGNEEQQKSLNVAYEAWEKATKEKPGITKLFCPPN